MILFLLMGVVLGGLAVIFALQNTAVITVSFLTWQLEGSLALILLLTIATGALVAMLLMLPALIKDLFVVRSMRKQKKLSEEELESLKKATVPSPPSPEVHL